MPIILVTAKADPDDIVAGLEAGGDEYLTKPVDHAALVARVRSILRIKALHDTVQEQAAQLEEWNRTLEQRVAAQVAEIERLGTLKRFLAPQVAELIVSAGDERLLESHRREITVVFCDLRGFTAFAETSEPEEVMGVLRQYHAALGELIFRHEGTLERFVGDGLVVLFNDPLPCPDPSARAVRMAIEMRARVAELAEGWRRQGHELGFGVGIAQGYATLGRIGFEGRFDYAAIGPVANLASRLCDEASRRRDPDQPARARRRSRIWSRPSRSASSSSRASRGPCRRTASCVRWRAERGGEPSRRERWPDLASKGRFAALTDSGAAHQCRHSQVWIERGGDGEPYAGCRSAGAARGGAGDLRRGLSVRARAARLAAGRAVRARGGARPSRGRCASCTANSSMPARTWSRRSPTTATARS